MAEETQTASRRATLRAVGGAAATAGVAGCLSEDTQADCPPPGTVETVSSLPRTAIGGASTTATVEVWEDLSCPHCATFATEVVPRLREEYVSAGDVRFVRDDFPIPVADWAWPAASAVRAAQQQAGAGAALAYAEEIYANQSEYTQKTLVAAANAAGVDPCVTVDAAETDQFRPVVEASKRRGQERGVSGTPAVFVDGNPVEFTDEISYASLRAAVEGAL